MAIPFFPDFKPLELSDREEVETFFRRFPQETSDYTFTNLFIWRNYDHPRLARFNGNLCVLLSPEDASPYFLPPVGEEKVEETLGVLFDYLKNSPQLRMVPEKFVKKHFEKRLEYHFELDRINLDYVYRTSDLVNLRGRKYDGKRNWIKRFLASYSSAEYVPLTKDLVPSCFELLERWRKVRAEPFLNYEVQAISEVLNYWGHLKLVARGVLISGKLEGFTMAGELNNETAIVYIQVASREIQGLPQFLNQKFTAEELLRYKYVNWEQDLGLPGLRKAKLSYHPIRLIPKYNVSHLKKS